MHRQLAAAVILLASAGVSGSWADDWTDEDWADEHGLGVDYAYTSREVKLEELFIRSSGLVASKFLLFLPEIIECHAAQYFEPRDSEPFDRPQVTQHIGEGRVDVLAENIRDVHEKHRYELISWRVRFALTGEQSGRLRIGLGQRVLTRRGTYSSWLGLAANVPDLNDYVWSRQSDSEHNGTRLVLGRVDDPEVPRPSEGALKDAQSRLLTCIRTLVAKGRSGIGCARPEAQGDVVETYAFDDEACASLPDIRRRLGVI